jgi:transcriptional regulator with XRE-family HTH domain
VANERLRSCITGARLTIAEVAAQVGVDPKTVERWIILDRVPHRSHRWATASLLGTDEAYLWPELADDRQIQATSTSELVTLYPNRGAVPGALWRSLLDGAADRIDVLVFAAGCSCRTATRRSPSCLPTRPSRGPRSVSP